MTTGKAPAEPMLKRELRTRLTLLRPETGKNIWDLQTDQYEDATFRARDLEPGSTVSVWNPRQDSRGKRLGGTIVQKLGPTNYLVNVRESNRYVLVDQLRSRDERSMPQVAETEETPISVALDQDTQRDKAAVEENTTAELGESSQETPTTATPKLSPGAERRYPPRSDRRPPARYRQG